MQRRRKGGNNSNCEKRISTGRAPNRKTPVDRSAAVCYGQNDTPSSLLFSPSLRPVRLPEVPCVKQREKHEIGDENTWCNPLPAIELPVKERPEDRRREERIRVRGDVNQHMQTPGSEFPERPLQQEPHEEKHGKEDDEAMGDIVEMMHILRNRRFRRCAVTEIGLFRQA